MFNLLLASAALLTAGAAPVQHDPLPSLTDEASAKLGVLSLDRMCSPRGVYQYDFGSTDLPPSLFNIPGMDKKELPETALPFTTVALDSTKWSNRFYRATFEMPLRKEDASRAIEQLAKHFRSLGWREVQGSDELEGTLIDPAPGPGEVNFYSANDD